MTSYPARIGYVKTVLESLLNQNTPHELYKIVLVLAIPEFPNRESDLPKDLLYFIANNMNMIEILWYPKNIRSHKKLMPVLKKYPNNPILVSDDDVYRPYWWVRMYVEDHIKYPNDIIFGASSWYFGGNYKLIRFNQFICKDSGNLNNLPSQVFKAAKPANGLGGTLYPVGTFTDPRFFDEDLMMKLTPTSDESWQFCFNVIENKTIRQSSKIVDYSQYFLSGSQDIKSSLHKVNNYTEINNRLFEAFPEYKSNLNRRFKDVIIALTSHGKRVQYLEKTLQSLLTQTLRPRKIVLTLHIEDVPNLTESVKQLIKDKKIELITCDKKIGPHTKYFYAMQKYRDYAVITVDDDHIYDRDLCESLWKSYINHPNIISARRVHLIKYDQFNRLLPYNKWGYNFKQMLNESKDLFATGVGGVLYPPDILHITDKNLPDIYKCLYADDIYLKYLENKKGIKTIWVKNDNTEGERINDQDVLECSLYNENVLNPVSNRNDEYLKIFKL